jgi:hypothetical protein
LGFLVSALPRFAQLVEIREDFAHEIPWKLRIRGDFLGQGLAHLSKSAHGPGAERGHFLGPLRDIVGRGFSATGNQAVQLLTGRNPGRRRPRGKIDVNSSSDFLGEKNGGLDTGGDPTPSPPQEGRLADGGFRRNRSAQ